MIIANNLRYATVFFARTLVIWHFFTTFASQICKDKHTKQNKGR